MLDDGLRLKGILAAPAPLIHSPLLLAALALSLCGSVPALNDCLELVIDPLCSSLAAVYLRHIAYPYQPPSRTYVA